MPDGLDRNAVRAAAEQLAAHYEGHLIEHEIAMEVGYYVPLDDDYPIEVPLGVAACNGNPPDSQSTVFPAQIN